MRGQWRVVALNNFLRKLVKRASIKRRCKSCHFVQKYAKGPNIGLEAVALALDDLRGEVIRCSNNGFRLGTSVGENARNSKITQLHDALFGAEDILTLQVSVQDFLVVAVLDCQRDLSEPV